MNKSDFERAFALAKSDVDLTCVDIDILFGCGLPDFQPVVATIRQVARHLRWQALQMNGEWDAEALTECRDILRRKVTMVDDTKE